MLAYPGQKIDESSKIFLISVRIYLQMRCHHYCNSKASKLVQECWFFKQMLKVEDDGEVQLNM
jgi:hypothetical protein